jgi:prolyl-tRNA synthetase
MKMSEFYLPTQKNTPKEAVATSHQLMLQAGLIKQVASGLYSWLPLGVRVLRKVETIVKQEMDAIGALEVVMPMVQPIELWKLSARDQQYGKELLQFHDRHDNVFCLGPTHEEIIVDLIKNQINSYKKLPLILYQIQNKFRDEIRPKNGVIRAREFLMKDAYSFHSNSASLEETYNKMYASYCKIFDRLGLEFKAVCADTGSIGGQASHEFQVLAPAGDDLIVYSDQSDYTANIEIATNKLHIETRPISCSSLKKISTPQQKTCADVAALLGVDIATTVKSLVYIGPDSKPVLLLLRAEDTLNEIKAQKLECLQGQLNLADEETIAKYFNCVPGFVGPVGFDGVVIADRNVAIMSDFICGANETGYHFAGVNFGIDCLEPIVADIRLVKEGDLSPDGNGRLKICHGIEVGHIFQLGTKYSCAMQAQFLDETGNSQDIVMGCYGIGISRIVAACIEQNHDEKGIIFPKAMAPFDIILCPLAYNKSDEIKTITDKIYILLIKHGYSILLDDRDIGFGNMMHDSELIGIPIRIVISPRLLEQDEVEICKRQNNEISKIKFDDIIHHISNII